MSGPCDIAPIRSRNIFIPGAGPGDVIVIDPSGNPVPAEFAPARIPTVLATIGTTESPLTTTQQPSGNPDNLDDVIFDTVSFDTFGGYDDTTGLYTVPLAGVYALGSLLSFNGFFIDDDAFAQYGTVFSSFRINGGTSFDRYSAKIYPANTANAGDGFLFGTIVFSTLVQAQLGDTLNFCVLSRGRQTGNVDPLQVSLASSMHIHYISKLPLPA